MCKRTIYDDLNAFNTSHNYLANKNVIMQGQGSFIAGGQLKQTTGDWAGKGPDTAATSFRFSRLYPQFKSLKWNNFVMRGDFLDNNGERPTEYYFHGNGRDNHGQSFLLGHIRPVGWKGGHRHIKTP
mgnify:CR=1 FL=1